LWLQQKGHVLVPSFGFQIIFTKKLLPYVLFFFFKIYLKKIDFFQNIA